MRALANLRQRICISIFHNLIYSSSQFWKFWPVYDLPACFSGPRHNVQLLIKSGKTCKLWASIIIYLKYILVVDEIFFLTKGDPASLIISIQKVTTDYQQRARELDQSSRMLAMELLPLISNMCKSFSGSYE